MMKHLVVITLFIPFAGSFALAQRTDSGERREIVVPKDTSTFTVKAAEVVRLSAQVAAGGTIKASVDGKASIRYSNLVREVLEGKGRLGLDTHEFEVQSHGDGKVTVTLTILPPTGEPSAKIYQFDVKGWRPEERPKFEEKKQVENR